MKTINRFYFDQKELESWIRNTDIIKKLELKSIKQIHETEKAD